MVSYTTAYLQIEDGNNRMATFELSIGFEETTEIEKNFVMANRGQFLQSIADNDVVNTGIEIDSTALQRSGYTIDGGAGTVNITLNFEAGMESESVLWGDGEGGTGPENVTETDASGAEVKALDRKQVLEYWIRRTRTDSFGQAALHWGQWTDGTIDGVSEGIYGEPITVAIMDANLVGPAVDDSSVFEGTITCQRVSVFPDPDQFPSWIADPAERIVEQVRGVSDR